MINLEYRAKQGNMGLARAIDYFVQQGYSVSIPLNDTQKYDLVVDNGEKIFRVQVKTCQAKVREHYYVVLKQSGGNQYYSNRDTKYRCIQFDNTASDYVYILDADGRQYLIPQIEITAKTSITLNQSYSKYRVYTRNIKEYN